MENLQKKLMEKFVKIGETKEREMIIKIIDKLNNQDFIHTSKLKQILMQKQIIKC